MYTHTEMFTRRKGLEPYSISGPAYVSEEKLLNSHISIVTKNNNHCLPLQEVLQHFELSYTEGLQGKKI